MLDVCPSSHLGAGEWTASWCGLYGHTASCDCRCLFRLCCPPSPLYLTSCFPGDVPLDPESFSSLYTDSRYRCTPSSLKQLLILSKRIQRLTLRDACHSCRVPSTSHIHSYTAHSWYPCPCLRLASVFSVWVYFQCLCPEPSHLRPPHGSQCHILTHDLPPS